MSPTTEALRTPLSTQLISLSTQLISELNDTHSMLRTTTERNGSTVVIYAGGEVDAGNEHTWQRLLSETAAATAPPGSLVVDARGLDFMGCCAFKALADQAHRCRCRGVGVRLVSCQPIVTRVVGACGLTEVLPIHATVNSALSAAAAGLD